MPPIKYLRSWNPRSRKIFDRDCVVRISQLSKFFARNGQHTLYRLLKGKLVGDNADSGSFAALNDINLEIMRAEKVGLIG